LWYTLDGTPATSICSASSQPCRKVSRGGNYVNYSYDAMDRRVTRTPQVEGSYTYGYDLLSESVATYKLSSGATPAHSALFTYDSAGRLRNETNDGRTIGHLFDGNGNRTQLTWPDGYFVNYQYDALNRMTYALENGVTELAYYHYDPLSHRDYLCFGGQSAVCQSAGTNKTSYTYEPDGDLSSITQLLGTASVTLSYGHNHSHQITNLSATDNFYLPHPGTGSVQYVPGIVNQYSAVGGNSTQYDGNGNLKTLFPATGSQTFSYDTENRLIGAAVAGGGTNSIFYDYDGLERRITKTAGGTALGSGGTTTNYLLDGSDEIAELDASGNVLRRYIPGPALDERVAVAEGSSISSPTRTYFHVDHEDSVMAMTDAMGNATGCAAGVNCQKLAYDEYGNLSPASVVTGEPYRYTGRRLDSETGMYYYRARYYSPSIGRFMQMDPVGSKDDLNLYAYVGNDPLDKTDPSGKIAGVDDAVELAAACAASAPCAAAVATAAIVVWKAVAGATETVYDHIVNSESAPAPSSDKSTGSNPTGSTLQPGEHAGDSIPARGPGRDFTPEEREKINEIGGTSGCHTCGTTDPGTKSGNFVPDHQPPSAVNPDGKPQRLYPQCLGCSRTQGGEVRQAKPAPPPPPPPPSPDQGSE
jgi:RHS repeat-associated protein